VVGWAASELLEIWYGVDDDGHELRNTTVSIKSSNGKLLQLEKIEVCLERLGVLIEGCLAHSTDVIP
jgi:hypothetical protein